MLDPASTSAAAAEMPFGIAATFVFIIGCCFGSFLNVCIWRMPRGESVVTAPSHCPNCNYHIRWYENIPLLSYLALRGKCSNCRKPITPRYFIVELMTGILFLLYFWQNPNPLALVSAGALVMLCIVTCFTDIEHRMIPDAATYPGMFIALAGAYVEQGSWKGVLLCAALGAATAAVLSLFTLCGRWLLKKDALGWGDVKFVVAASMLLCNPFGAFFVLLFGSLTGAFFGIGYALSNGKKMRGMAIPFGPFLAVGALLWLFFGAVILNGYLAAVGALAK